MRLPWPCGSRDIKASLCLPSKSRQQRSSLLTNLMGLEELGFMEGCLAWAHATLEGAPAL